MQDIADGVLVATPSKKAKRRPSMSSQAKERRRRVIVMLEHQLKIGRKPSKISDETHEHIWVPLEEKDINRIKKELDTLKGRI